MLKYNRSSIANARSLRKEMTPWERKLWYDFLRHYPVRFQRQKSIDRFIVDFYCAKAKLIIELDGSGHYSERSELYDENRTQVLRQYNLQVLRFTNLEIDQHFHETCCVIDDSVRKCCPVTKNEICDHL